MMTRGRVLVQVGALVVLGAQWGDEGKGKIVDVLCEDMDIVCTRTLHTPNNPPLFVRPTTVRDASRRLCAVKVYSPTRKQTRGPLR